MKKAIILGGTEDHIRLIELLKNKGFFTILIDYYNNPPAKSFADEFIQESTLDKEKVLSIAKSIKPELVIALCIDQALLTMAYVSEKLDLYCYLSYEKALNFTNKAFMKSKMKEHDIPTSKFCVLKNKDDLSEAIDKLSFPIVIKPSDSNSSKGISKASDIDDLNNAVREALKYSNTGSIILEEYINGEEYSAEFFIKGGQPDIIVTTKTFKSNIHSDKFIITNSMSPSGLTKDDFNLLIKIAQKIASAFDLNSGPLFMQFLKQGNDINVIEFSARIGGGSRHHFVLHSTDFDYLNYLVNFCLGKIDNYKLNHKNNYYGCHFVYAHNGIFNQLVNFDKCKDIGLVLDYYLYKPRGTAVAGNNSSSHRLLCFITEGKTYDDLKEKVDKVDKTVAIADNNGNDIMIHGLFYAVK